MKKLVFGALSLVAAASLNAAVFATVDGMEVTDNDLAPLVGNLQGVDLSALPAEVKKQIVDRAIDIKLLTKKAYESGIENDEIFKNQMKIVKDAIAVRSYQLKQTKEIKIDDEEIKKFYDTNKEKFVEPAAVSASHILVANVEAAQGIINDLKKVKKEDLNAEFAKKATELSIDPTAKATGGDLGWFAPEQMVKEFSEALSKMKTGEMSQKPVKSQFGYHIILKTGDRAKKQLTLDETKPYIENVLRQEKAVKLTQETTEELRKNAKIEYK